ncbi:cytochrome P450 [Nemania sp. NC0429]|nr:cytochrome P450 [Nemania sp. NC0429]
MAPPVNLRLYVTVTTWLQQLEKMDSFIIESQRLKPLILLTPQRMAMVPTTLKGRTNIPVGTRIAWAGPHHALDPNVISNPTVFDPLRSYRRRHVDGGKDANKYLAGQSDPDNMSFGYGGQVCPGRYFAVCEIKLIIMRLIREFDFAMPDGAGVPRIIHVNENVILDPGAKFMMRKRQVPT